MFNVGGGFSIRRLMETADGGQRIMWIKCNNDATMSIYVDDVTDGAVEFSSNGTAQVTSEVGEELIKRYSSVYEVSSSDDDDDGESDANE